MQYQVFHFENEEYLSNITVYNGKLMIDTIQAKYNAFLYHRISQDITGGQILMCIYLTAYIPKYVHFHQVTLSSMRKWVVSQCNRQTTNTKHLETSQLRYAIRGHDTFTEIEGLVAWKQEAEGLSWLGMPCQCQCFLLPSERDYGRAGKILILSRKPGYFLVQGTERSGKMLRHTV